ncbi:MAG TPA: DNA-directed RNA polymerase subunit beta, partial [Candidatus Kapabacteria bacterium]|nr:DNA-directed RNA polymerase subunit beta [Candidatus Kapabacteria bacterium]
MKTNGQAKARVTFAKTQSVVEFPDLLDVQVQSFKDFLQAEIPPRKRKLTGLHQAFLTNFPIADTSEIFDLEFKEYYLEKPKYTVDECRERELTYAAALKARLRLSSKAEQGSEDWIDTVEQDVYLGTIPIMTDHGTFIINGAERVVVSQLHRSPGVFFSDAIHPNGTRIVTARIIPMRGSWVEFSTDINNVIFVYIDRKKK